MFPRLLYPAFFIGLAVVSPWLVQDWLNGRTGEGESRVYSAVSSFPDRLRSKFDSTFSLASRPEVAPKSESTGSSLPPYPVASRTKKLLQGLIPSSMLATAGMGGSLDETLEVPTSVRVDSIAAGVRKEVAVDLSRLGLGYGDPVFVRVFKEEAELELWMRGNGGTHFTLFKVYRIRHWSGNTGPKLRDGDGQGPEGFYHVSASRFRPETRHHLGLDLGYPNDLDRHLGRTGGDIMIHGGSSSVGSFALAPEDMEEVYTLAGAALKNGQKFFRVNSFPFRMTDKRMEQEWKRQPDWIDFWINLKEGYDFFENVNVPPDAQLSGDSYAFLTR